MPSPRRWARTARSARGWPKCSNASRGAPDSVYSVNGVAALVGAVVEEGAEARAADAGGGVGDGLQQRAQVELAGQRRCRCC